MRYVTGVLAVVVLAAAVRGQGLALKGVDLKAEGPSLVPAVANPMAIFPADQQHVFRAVDAEWTKKTVWLEPQGESLREVDADPNNRALMRQETYFDTPNTSDWMTHRKIMRYYPDGTLALEVDRDGATYWERRLRNDKTVFEYSYYPHGNLTAAYSIRQDGKVMSVFLDSGGDFIRWNATGDGFVRFIGHDGQFPVSETFSGGKCVMVQLQIKGGINLRHDLDGESLTIMPRTEQWTFRGDIAIFQGIGAVASLGGVISTPQATVPADEINTRQLALMPRSSRSGPRPQPATPEVILQRRADYLTRRGELMAGVAEELKAAGYTLAGLGLAKFRDDPGALPTADPAWYVASGGRLDH